jgi:type III pantothenate kinase
VILTIDIGNTNSVFGVFKGKELLTSWRIHSNSSATEDEMGIALLSFLREKGIPREEITGVIVSSVVPPLMPTLERMFPNYLGLEAMIVGPGIKTGMPIKYENPKEVGSDRIVNGVAAYEKYGGPLIVVDFGTATTFDALAADGAYLGGAIAPGVWISMEALFQRTSKLPRIDLIRPESVIGRNTVNSIQAGIHFGTIGLVKEIITRMKGELGGDVGVVATGGHAAMIAEETDLIQVVDPLLTLEGLRIIYERNRQ